MILVHELTKNFGKLNVLQKISTRLEGGISYALVGPNGSGKTTLIKCILGMVIQDDGYILVNDEPILGKWEYRENIGYMPQIGRYPDNMKIGQLLDMILDIRPAQVTTDDDLINEFGLRKIADKRMHTLSGGTRQKVSAALAFLFDPAILILDEPTAGLDPIAVEIIKEKILSGKKKEKVFIISSHILSDLDELSTHLLCLEDGKLLCDNSIENLKEQTGEEKLGKAIASMMKQNQTEFAL